MVNILFIILGQQQYGNNYFTNLNEFIDFCPFNLITKVEINNIEDDCIHTSCILKSKKFSFKILYFQIFNKNLFQ